MKLWFKHVILFLVLAGGLGVAVMLSGIIPVGASGGHWPITAALLNFSMGRSVSLRGHFNEPPKNLSDPAMIMRGAGHYEISCKMCHGGPDVHPALGQSMTAKAPWLKTHVPLWSDEELFEIVKHGVKFTGMPAWASQNRDDEVWAMVAFLKRLPGMELEEYRKLVYVEGVKGSCSNCHGKDGNGREGSDAFPKLAGQNQQYLENALRAYASGKRQSGTMQIVASALGEEMIREFSRYYGSLDHSSTASTGSLESIKRGELIAREGIPAKRVAACMGCHGSEKNEETKRPYFPKLAGQHARYLKDQLRLILEDKRGGSESLKLMRKAVPELSDEEMEDVANYFESLGR